MSLVPTPAIRIATIGAGTWAIYAAFTPNNVSNHEGSQQLANVTLI